MHARQLLRRLYLVLVVVLVYHPQLAHLLVVLLEVLEVLERLRHQCEPLHEVRGQLSQKIRRCPSHVHQTKKMTS